MSTRILIWVWRYLPKYRCHFDIWLKTPNLRGTSWRVSVKIVCLSLRQFVGKYAKNFLLFSHRFVWLLNKFWNVNRKIGFLKSPLNQGSNSTQQVDSRFRGIYRVIKFVLTISRHKSAVLLQKNSREFQKIFVNRM